MILLLLRILLAAVFAAAAAGKLVSQGKTAATLGEFGVPGAHRRPLAVALPLAELAIAVTLLPPATAAWAALAATVLLAAFTLAVARVLIRGDDVDCNCFGSLGSSRITGWTAARNGGLLAIAAAATIAGWNDPGTSAVAWLGDLESADAALLAAGVAIALGALNFAFSWQLMRQNGRLLTELEELKGGASGRSGPQPGAPAPAFDLPALGGGHLTLERLLAPGMGLTLIFTDPGCGACDPLLPEVGRLQRDPATATPLVLISRGDFEDNRAKAAEHGLEPLLIEEKYDVARSFGVNGAPGLVQLDPEGRFVAKPAMGAERVGQALADLASSGPTDTFLTVHREVPDGR